MSDVDLEKASNNLRIIHDSVGGEFDDVLIVTNFYLLGSPTISIDGSDVTVPT